VGFGSTFSAEGIAGSCKQEVLPFQGIVGMCPAGQPQFTPPFTNLFSFGLQRRRVSELYARLNTNPKSVFN